MRTFKRIGVSTLGVAVTASCLAAISSFASDPAKQPVSVGGAAGDVQLAVFSRPATASDALPKSEVVTFGPSGPAAELGIDTSTSRLVYANGVESIYVVRGSGRICAIRATTESRSSACRPETKDLAATPLTTAEVEGARYRVWGVLPDGARVDAIAGAGSSKVTAPARGGAFSAVVDDPTALQWTATDGSRQTQPLLTLSEGEKQAG